MKKIFAFLVLTVSLIGTGLVAGWLLLGRPAPTDQLSRAQVKAIFGEYGLRQYDKILQYNRRYPGVLQVGDMAPDLQLQTVDGSPARISDYHRDRPLVLVFGSYT